MRSEIYTAADDHPPSPRIELNVVYWSERNQTARDFSAASAAALPFGVIAAPFLAGSFTGPNNRMVVDCGVFLDANDRRVLWQRFDAGPGLSGGEAAAGSNAGAQILGKIFERSRPAMGVE